MSLLLLNKYLIAAPPDSFIFYSPEKVFRAIEFVKQQQEVYKQSRFINESSLL